MIIVYIMQVLLWPSYGSTVNLTLPDPHIYATYDECMVDAKLLTAEAEKTQGYYRYSYVCRPGAAYAKNGT